MALPKMTTPTYELEIPSTDEKVQYRPFLVKEEKILLIAMESGKSGDIIEAVKQIVSACTFDKLDLNNIPITWWALEKEKTIYKRAIKGGKNFLPFDLIPDNHLFKGLRLNLN